MNKYGISEECFANIMKCFEDITEIKQVILFGSRARGDFKKTSDIDLAVCFEGQSQKLKLIRALDEIKCILTFDVIDIQKIANQELFNNIKKDGTIIYERSRK